MNNFQNLDNIHNKIKHELKEVFVEKKTCIKTFFTFHLPPNLKPSADQMPTLAHLLIKRHDFGTYLYCYEIGTEKKNLHFHLASSKDFSRDFFKIKRAWSSICEKHFSVKFTKTNMLISCDYQNVISTWEKVLDYCCKQMFDLKQIMRLNEIFGPDKHVRLYGGSKDFSRIFSIYRKLLESKNISSDSSPEENNEQEKETQAYIESNDFSPKVLQNNLVNVKDINQVFQSISKEYLIDFPSIPVEDIKNQFLYEIHQYTDVLFLYNEKDFNSFVEDSNSTIGIYYSCFYKFIQSIVNNPDILLSFRKNMELFLAKQKHTRQNPISEALFSYFVWDKSSQKVQIADFGIVHFLINCIYLLHKEPFIKKLNLFIKLANNMVKKLVFSNSFVFENPTVEQLTRLGHILYSTLQKSALLLLGKYIEISEEVSSVEDSDSPENEDSEDNLNFNESSSIFISFSFTNLASDKLNSLFKKNKQFKLEHLSMPCPMLVPPKKWKIVQVSHTKNNINYYNASKNYTGGLLLNNYLVFRPLCKSYNLGNAHSLFVTEAVINYVNKMQSNSFIIDRDIKEFYLSNKMRIPGILNRAELNTLKVRFTFLRRTIFSLFKEKAKLVKEKLPDLSIIKNKISSLTIEKKDIMSKLDQHKLISRLLSTLEGLNPDSPLFFSYEFDFRMRLYCNPFEFSFMGSKFVRSFLRFNEYRPLDVKQFSLYSVLQYCAARDLSETQINALFTEEVSSVLSNFPKNIKLIFEQAREPFMFIACCFEWQRKSQSKSQFLSNIPIYLDCSANGPQLIALFFALRDFGQFLNLVPQKSTDVRSDFYSTLISKFILLQQAEKWVYLQKKIDRTILPKFCSSVMRPLLKNNIMTRFYGVSFLKFSSTIKEGFKSKQKDLASVFSFSESNYMDFTATFASKFWKFTSEIPLFQLEELLHMVHKLSHNKRSMDWSVFDVNIIQMYYTNTQRYRYDSQAGSSRSQFVLHKPIENSTSPKQRSAFMANFVHSLDAYVLYRTCAELGFPIIPIHDSFGVHSCDVAALRLKIRELFAFLVDNRAASKFFISQLADLLSDSASPEVKEDFLRFVNKRLKFGTLSKNDVVSSYYYIYYN